MNKQFHHGCIQKPCLNVKTFTTVHINNRGDMYFNFNLYIIVIRTILIVTKKYKIIGANIQTLLLHKCIIMVY